MPGYGICVAGSTREVHLSIKRKVTWRALGWFTLLLGLSVPSLLLAQDGNRAAIVVRLTDGQVESRCVTFDEPQISGYEALTRAGYDVESQALGLGSLICRVEGQGCPVDDCLCQCQGGPDCVYWSYWHLIDGSWQYATVGATSYQLSDGSVDGWSWGPGSVTAAVEPPLLAFEEVCTEAAASPTADPLVNLSPAASELDLTNWLPYLAFGLILLVLVGLVLLRRRQAG